MSDQDSHTNELNKAPDKELKKIPARELRKVPDRMVVDARDVMNITGRNLRASQRLLRQIRLAFGKPETALVSRQEFCAYCCLDEEEVKKYLQF